MRNLSRKFIALIAGFVAFSTLAVAQNPAVFGGVANAYAFAYGINSLVAPLQVDLAGGPTAAGVATLTVAFGTTTLGDGTVITPLSTLAPITVGTGANAETVTPSAVSCGTPTVYQSCSFTATFTNAHGTGDKVASASWGLNEAQIFLTGKFGGGLVLINGAWIRAAGLAYTHAAINTFLTTGSLKSASLTATVLDYSGISSATAGSTSHSYQAASAVGGAFVANNVIY